MILTAAATAGPTVTQLLLTGIAGATIALLGVLIKEIFAVRVADRTWKRERKKADTEEQRKLYLEVAEWVENEQAWLRGFEYGLHNDQAELGVHENQLAGRLALQDHPELKLAWDDYLATKRGIQWDLKVGNLRLVDEALGEVGFEDETRVPDAVVRATVLTLMLNHFRRHEVFHAELFAWEVIDALEERGVRDPQRFGMALTSWLSAKAEVWGSIRRTDRRGQIRYVRIAGWPTTLQWKTEPEAEENPK